MKVSKQYTLQSLAGIPYLLPFGQNIAAYKRGLQLNESGVFLWECLQKGMSREELLDAMIQHYEADAQDRPVLEEDLDIFLQQLSSLGILEKEAPVPKPDCYFCIGGLTIGYSGDCSLLLPSLADFSCEASETMLSAHIIVSADVPFRETVGEVLIKTALLEICRDQEFITLTFPQQKGVPFCRISADGRFAWLSVNPNAGTETLKQDVFFTFRDVFLLFAQEHGLFALHSASVLYREKAWLFSGPSGTGKSTHTNLWHKLYDTPFLNGDLNLCRIEGDSVMVYGMPWCGTSGIYTKEAYPLGGIILLRQSPENRIEELSADKQQLLVSQRLISPSWTEERLVKNLSFAGGVRERCLVFRLSCNMEDEAAETVKEYIDHKDIPA